MAHTSDAWARNLILGGSLVPPLCAGGSGPLGTKRAPLFLLTPDCPSVHNYQYPHDDRRVYVVIAQRLQKQLGHINSNVDFPFARIAEILKSPKGPAITVYPRRFIRIESHRLFGSCGAYGACRIFCCSNCRLCVHLFSVESGIGIPNQHNGLTTSACSEPSREAETSDAASASSEHVSTNTDGDGDDDEDETTFQYFYQFEDREVELPHLEMDNGPVSVNIRDCMLYLLSDVDPFQLRDNTILSQQWQL
eukprot:scaffold6550_cov74-Cyclotella_meneghiniana.AAC.10